MGLYHGDGFLTPVEPSLLDVAPLRKYDLAEHFKARKPDYVTEWVHEMLWGKGLRQIAKRGIELVQEARQKHGDQARINLHLAWFGNELVGENGIAQSPNWPYDGPNGHWPDLMADSLRHLRWLKDKCQELDVRRSRDQNRTQTHGVSLTFMPQNVW